MKAAFIVILAAYNLKFKQSKIQADTSFIP